MAHTHLTADERYQIYELKVQGHSNEAIAKALGRSSSTISRELRRNVGLRGYRPVQAQQQAVQRRQVPRRGRRVSEETQARCIELITQHDYSPMQAAGRCKLEGTGSVSHEWIYQMIYRDKRAGGLLWRSLRCQKKRRKRYGSGRSRRGQIPNRVGIEKRCPRVESRSIIGHWEADTVIGKSHKHVMVTLVERKSGYSVVRWAPSKNATVIADTIIEALRPLAALVRTMTFDNGLEFAQHERVAKGLNAKTYFADAYCSWQRGTNENFNGLLRQYFPKGSSFAGITAKRVKWVQDRINNRARERLDWLTPTEVMTSSSRRRDLAIVL
jgi:transposase, IS30 family